MRALAAIVLFLAGCAEPHVEPMPCMERLEYNKQKYVDPEVGVCCGGCNYRKCYCSKNCFCKQN